MAQYTVSLRDVTPTRATVTAVAEGDVGAESSYYALVGDDMRPVIGERVWIDRDRMASWGPVAITGRGLGAP